MTVFTETDLYQKNMQAEVCVVGGGMSGICAAIASARNGVKTILVQDRPVLGGNASSEVRMWICGAHGKEQREAGILDEIILENMYLNPQQKYTVWDHILYSKVTSEENLTLLLNTSVVSVDASDQKISKVKAWQLTSQTWIDISADYFIDCSGDSILRFCGAEFRKGREGKDEFHESNTTEKEDACTMGNSILIQVREVDEHIPFKAPDWAHHYEEEDLPKRSLKCGGTQNFWWLEVGGMMDTIKDAEEIRHENLKIAYGVWECLKNHPDGRGHGWELEWIGSLPGKRENIRYVGDHILTQGDIEAEGKFDDMVAYGGWSMDDHHPEGIEYKDGAPTIFHKAPSPYGIPFRCLYSKNISNLYFAGRNISTTHMALSSTRVMGTCSIIGQAVGIAASLSVKNKMDPRAVYENKIGVLQKLIFDQDGFLPWRKREIDSMNEADNLCSSKGDTINLVNGVDRVMHKEDNGVWLEEGQNISIEWGEAKKVSSLRMIHDSDFYTHRRMPCKFPKAGNYMPMPPMMIQDYEIEVLDANREWVSFRNVSENHKRYDVQKIEKEVFGIRMLIKKTWGDSEAHVFAFEAIS